MTSSRRMFIAFLLNLSFSLVELVFGLIFRSSAVLADALHDAGDALAIGCAVFLEKYANKPADEQYPLGYQRFSLLGSLLTGLILLLGSVFVVVENLPKLFAPEKVNHRGMLVLGLVAIVINFLASRFVSHGDEHQGHHYNEAMLSLHFLEDILGWLAVILVALVIPLTQWYFLDPLLSIAIALFILSKTLPEWLSAIKILLNAKPDDLDSQALKQDISKVEGVLAVSNLMVFTMSNQEHWALLYITITPNQSPDDIKIRVRQCLDCYGISNSVIDCL